MIQLIELAKENYFNKEQFRNVEIIFIKGAAYFAAIAPRYKDNQVQYHVIALDKNEVQHSMNDESFHSFYEAKMCFQSIKSRNFNATKTA